MILAQTQEQVRADKDSHRKAKGGHLYAKGSNGQSAGVDWGPTSDVETRSDSVSYTSSSPVTFNIDYYETVSWQVEFYRYE